MTRLWACSYFVLMERPASPALFSPPIDEFTFLVEIWQGSAVERVVAGAQHIRLARAAYASALEVYGDRRLKLRHGARVIEANEV